MVSALLNLSENTNRVLNTIKAKNGYRDKSQAVEYLVDMYIEEKDDPELKPEFIEELKRIEKEGKFIEVKESLAERYGLKNVQKKTRRKTR